MANSPHGTAIEPIWLEWLALGGMLQAASADGWAAEYLAALRANEEPSAKTAGALYIWVNAIDKGKPIAQPRAYKLPYAKDLHALLNESMKKARQGISQMGTAESKTGKKGIGRLRPGADFPPEIRHNHQPVQMTYRIDALGQAVATSAGQFNDCIRVVGSAVMRLFADPVVGYRDMPLATTEWYCKGVGLVKLQRSEPANSTFLTGGAVTLELTEWP